MCMLKYWAHVCTFLKVDVFIYTRDLWIPNLLVCTCACALYKSSTDNWNEKPWSTGQTLQGTLHFWILFYHPLAIWPWTNCIISLRELVYLRVSSSKFCLSFIEFSLVNNDYSWKWVSSRAMPAFLGTGQKDSRSQIEFYHSQKYMLASRRNIVTRVTVPAQGSPYPVFWWQGVLTACIRKLVETDVKIF